MGNDFIIKHGLKIGDTFSYDASSSTMTLNGPLINNSYTGSTERMMKINESGLTIAEDVIIDMTLYLTDADTTGVTLFSESGWNNNTKTRDGYEGQRAYGVGELGCVYECFCTYFNVWSRSYSNPYVTHTGITTALSNENNWSTDTYSSATYGNVGMKYDDNNYEYQCVSGNTWKRYPTNAKYVDTYILLSGVTSVLQSGASWSGSTFSVTEPTGDNTIYDGQWYKDTYYFYHKIYDTIYRQPILTSIQNIIYSVTGTTTGWLSGLTATTNLTLTPVSGSGDDTNINNNLNDISSQYNKLRSDYEDLRAKFNTLFTYLQNHNLISKT